MGLENFLTSLHPTLSQVYLADTLMLAFFSIDPTFIPTVLTGWKEIQEVNAASVTHKIVVSLDSNRAKTGGEGTPHRGTKTRQSLASFYLPTLCIEESPWHGRNETSFLILPIRFFLSSWTQCCGFKFLQYLQALASHLFIKKNSHLEIIFYRCENCD